MPLEHITLKLAIIFVSGKAGVKLILRAKLILAGIIPRSGAKLKNCWSNSPSSPQLSIWNSAGTSELFLRTTYRLTLLVTSTCPKSIYAKLTLKYGYFPTALNLTTLCSYPSTSSTTVPTVTEAYLGVNYILN